MGGAAVKYFIVLLLFCSLGFAQDYTWARGAWINHGGNFYFSVNSGQARLKITCNYFFDCLIIEPFDQHDRFMELLERYPSESGEVEKYAIDVPLIEHYPDELFTCWMWAIGPAFDYKFEVEAAEPPVHWQQEEFAVRTP